MNSLKPKMVASSSCHPNGHSVAAWVGRTASRKRSKLSLVPVCRQTGLAFSVKKVGEMNSGQAITFQEWKGYGKSWFFSCDKLRLSTQSLFLFQGSCEQSRKRSSHAPDSCFSDCGEGGEHAVVGVSYLVCCMFSSTMERFTISRRCG